MVRSVLIIASFVAIGAVALSLITSWPADDERQGQPPRAAHSQPPSARSDAVARADRPAPALEQRLEQLESELVEEAAQRRRLEERLEALSAQIAAAHGDAAAEERTPAHSNAAPSGPDTSAPEAPLPASEYGVSEMERALVAAGLDAASAAQIKRRGDELTMAEMYLRDQATREQWLDTPRFHEEMAALNAQQVPLREEIGEDAYDRYLFARGHANRVRVDDVLSESPAAHAGVQTGDLIVRYDDGRIFAPAELVAQTRTGGEGETIRLEIIRNGERLQIEVPRGPLGLRVAPTQAAPETS
jgi:hypothetical protein